jgi:hypothetical protein
MTLGERKELIRCLQEHSIHHMRLNIYYLNEKPSGEPATSNKLIAFNNY